VPCKACGIDDGLEVCLYCGHSFCSHHRGESGGVPACTECLRAESSRKRKPAKVAPPAPPARGGQPEPAVQVEERTPAPLPEPKSGLTPVLSGLGAALCAAGYVYWMIPKISASTEGVELASWVQPAGAGAAGLVAFLGVWAIVKTKL
jgi:hypothetical protein